MNEEEIIPMCCAGCNELIPMAPEEYKEIRDNPRLAGQFLCPLCGYRNQYLLAVARAQLKLKIQAEEQ